MSENTSKNFYIVIEIQDRVFDESLNGFEKLVDKEIEAATKDLRQFIKEAYFKHNSALGDSDETD